MDQQVVSEYIAQAVAAIVSVFVFILKYRDVLSFVVKVAKYPIKMCKCLKEVICMPIQLNKEAIAARERMDKVEATLNDLTKFVKKELTYNGGSSTLDAIRRIENRIIEQEYAQNALMLDDANGIFRCDMTGHNRWVNRTFARYLGCGTNELIGLGWKRFIKGGELRRYNEVWQAAFKDGCEFEDVVEFIDTDDKPLKLRIVAAPVIDDKGKLLSYVGTVSPAENV